MQVKTLKLGNLTIKNNIFLAPIAGYSDYPFRSLALNLGYGLTFTELVSAKGIIYGSKRGTQELLCCGEQFDQTVAQIFGGDPYFMRSACEGEDLAPYNIIDINMGCPVPKVYKNGEGSALLNDIHKAETIIKECVKSGKIITVKIRTGLKKGDDIATEFTKMAENAGASLVTIHGRVREDYYSGEPNFDAIYNAKKSVNIPVIANGGIFTKDDATNMIERTGADGIMIARGGIANPFLCLELLGEEPNTTLKEFMKSQLAKMFEFYGDGRTYREFRKFVPYYFKGMSHSKDLRLKLMSAQSTHELLDLIDQNL